MKLFAESFLHASSDFHSVVDKPIEKAENELTQPIGTFSYKKSISKMSRGMFLMTGKYRLFPDIPRMSRER